MPPAVAAGAAAAAPAVGQIGGAIIQSRAQNKATEAQQQSAREALAFSKERLAGGDADYARKMQAWEAGRQALMERYGIDIVLTGETPTAAGDITLVTFAVRLRSGSTT